MKATIVWLLVGFFSLVLVGCGDDDSTIPDGGGDSDDSALDTNVDTDSHTDENTDNDTDTLERKYANLTNFESYPDPESEECIEYNGCQWEGQFAALDEKQTEAWVEAHNIAAVHSKHFEEFKLKTLRLWMEESQIDVTVYDMCADSDCDGCCTKNSEETGFLIDIEKYTMERFGYGSGIVEWACLDCSGEGT